jgi:hypothetical protein
MGEAVNAGTMVAVGVIVDVGVTVAVSVGGGGVYVIVGLGAAKAIPPHADNKIDTPKVNIKIFFILVIEFPD